MSNDTSMGWFVLIVGAVIGAMIMGCLTTWVGPFARADLEAARNACEKSLPRDQYCVVQYVPEKEKL